MSDPETYEEYVKLYNENQEITGFGVDVAMHMPCPFCAASHFICYRITEVQERMSRGAVCKECGRGAKCVFEVDGNSTAFEMVQTTGPDPAEWMPVRMRRLG